MGTRKKRPLPSSRPVGKPFVKGDPRAVIAAKHNQSFYRDEVTQTLISILNEEIDHVASDKGMERVARKKKLYVMLDRLVALGLGIQFKMDGKKFQYAPDLKAINTILDRLIGKPKQQIDMKPEGGKLVIEFGPGDDGDD